eukprot:Opistho-2@72757
MAITLIRRVCLMQALREASGDNASPPAPSTAATVAAAAQSDTPRTSTTSASAVAVAPAHVAVASPPAAAVAVAAVTAPAAVPVAAPAAEPTRTIEIPKGPSGLGFNVMGGAEQQSPIYVSRIIEGGVAAKIGLLRRGDALLAVNGESTDGASHERAVQLLKAAVGSVTLTVQFRLPGG